MVMWENETNKIENIVWNKFKCQLYIIVWLNDNVIIIGISINNPLGFRGPPDLQALPDDSLTLKSGSIVLSQTLSLSTVKEAWQEFCKIDEIFIIIIQIRKLSPEKPSNMCSRDSKAESGTKFL
jgi:hypothetical protein